MSAAAPARSTHSGNRLVALATAFFIGCRSCLSASVADAGFLMVRRTEELHADTIDDADRPRLRQRKKIAGGIAGFDDAVLLEQLETAGGCEHRAKSAGRSLRHRGQRALKD